MSEAVLISIQPKWCELIASGKKTIEVRKTRPKIETPFKCYIYCTSVKSMNLTDYVHIHSSTNGMVDEWNGKVIGEFICPDIDRYLRVGTMQSDIEYLKVLPYYFTKPVDFDSLCMTSKQFEEYGKGRELYGWHISELKIYDQPIPLEDFYHWRGWSFFSVERPPQSWMYVEELE